MEYKIIEAQFIDILIERVKESIEEGWEVSGSMSSSGEPTSGKDYHYRGRPEQVRIIHTFRQPMLK
jgi:hypothetical protein